MSVFKFHFCLIVILGFGACNQKKPSSKIKDIDLLRGNITLCGDGGFGEVNFALDCNLDVRETFNLAISLLHSFEYNEAEKAFVQVIDADPNCAMAYWGVAMSNFHALWLQSGTDYLVKGSKILKASSSLEKSEKAKDYINAISSFYDDWENVSHKERVELFENKMRQVYLKYGDDREAAIFYALALRAASDPSDKTYSNQKESGKILESIYQDQPNHPGIAHYIIHNYDYPELAELALPTARRYAEIAPASAHAQHMPSHIFTRLGLWKESINSNLNSTAAALCYAKSIDINGHWDEELHGMDYLVYAYLQKGDNRMAQEQYDYLKTFNDVFPANFKVAYAAAAIPSRIALENKNWESASKLELPSLAIEWSDFPWQRSLLHFARAMGAVRSGKLKQTESELNVLELNLKELVYINDSYKANQVQIQINIIRAWLQFSNGGEKEALSMMKQTTEMEYNTNKHPVTPGEILPAGEIYGDLLLEANQPLKALKAYESDLKRHPGRLNGIFGAAVAAKSIGDEETANRYFNQLISQCADSHSERNELLLAKDYLGRPEVTKTIE
ncbi:hypothetical protein [Marinoscillum sp. MHG1-6]|uniref:hypothetical protein n=1 Tax=Marinoscillum sp. MHG1-6 TaxID=2959627 RepID=UPI002157D324|nr:hypothetical protein [Marinoscillum sp. MHG1-6]